MRNRWWTLAFAAFVCWSAYDYAKPENKEPDVIASALGGAEKPLDDAQVKALEQAFGPADKK